MLAALRSPTIRGCCGASCDQRGVLHLRQAPQGLRLYPSLGRLPRVAVERCRHIPNRDRRRTDTDLTISSALPSPTPAFSRANPPDHLPASATRSVGISWQGWRLPRLGAPSPSGGSRGGDCTSAVE